MTYTDAQSHEFSAATQSLKQALDPIVSVVSSSLLQFARPYGKRDLVVGDQYGFDRYLEVSYKLSDRVPRAIHKSGRYEQSDIVTQYLPSSDMSLKSRLMNQGNGEFSCEVS